MNARLVIEHIRVQTVVVEQLADCPAGVEESAIGGALGGAALFATAHGLGRDPAALRARLHQLLDEQLDHAFARLSARAGRELSRMTQ
jgi:hypothetical protein